MKLYIPEIGDHVVLTKDWKFTLHAESRNLALGELNGYYLYGYNKWVLESDLPRMRTADYNVPLPSDDECKNWLGRIDYQKQRDLWQERLNADATYCKYIKDLDDYNEIAKKIGKESIEITLKKGTILSVDRIYIRKGASDYSSITFYAKNIGESMLTYGYFTKKTKKVKAHRFWVKLSDGNKIEFEKHEQ